MSPPGRLVDRVPASRAADLAAGFVVPRRFAGARFDTYVPNPAHPSQAEALSAMRAFAAAAAAATAAASAGEGVVADKRGGGAGRFAARARRGALAALRRRGAPGQASGRPARYLDGGFGVGKTHLLAALWHESPEPRAFLTFAELASYIGFAGMAGATASFRRHRIVCIDEFELDDVANTLLAVTFLRSVIAAGVMVAATSNTLPDRLGEGRFAAEDFTREIAAVAGHFEVLRIEGPDYRAASRVDDPAPLRSEQLELLADRAGAGTVTRDRFPELLAHLRLVHPVQYGALLSGLDAVLIDGLAPIENQGSALLFVQLVDELYEAGVVVGLAGCPIDEVFPATYRSGGYRKKYGRAESRLEAMVAEARARLAAAP